MATFRRVLLIGGILLLLGLTVYLMSGCDVCTRGSGVSASETRNVSEFDRIVVRGNAHLILVQDTTALRLEADDNLLPMIVTEVDGRELVIDTMERGCTLPRAPVRVYAGATRLQRVQMSGAGSVTSQTPVVTDDLEIIVEGSNDVNLTLNARQLRTEVSGEGQLTYQGSVQAHEIDVSGSGRIDAPELVTRETRIGISGSGEADVYAAEELDVSISGSGDVRYRGEPRVRQTISGRGSVNATNST